MVDETFKTMLSLRFHLKRLYPYTKPNFYIPQSLLDSFVLVLVLSFSIAESTWTEQVSIKLDEALPVNLSPFESAISQNSDQGFILQARQNICVAITKGFANAKMELLVGLMYRPELPLKTRMTTYEIADAEAILMLVIEHIMLGVHGDNDIDLVKESVDALKQLVRHHLSPQFVHPNTNPAPEQSKGPQ
jgi:hypothetical protein